LKKDISDELKLHSKNKIEMTRALLFISLLFSCGLSIAQVDLSGFNYFQKTDYNMKVAESNTYKNGTLFQKLVIDGFDSKVPFFLIKPKSDKEDRFVFLLHGINGSKNDWIYPMTSLCEKYIKLKDSLLTLGYSLIIPDAKYHGERSYEANFTSPLSFYSSQDIQKAYNLFSTTVKDIRIIMDYIEYRSANTTVAFDVIGYSMGGVLAIYLNSIDNRLNKVVACVAPLNAKKSSMRIGMNEKNAEQLASTSPKSYAHLQKAPITLLMGKKDGWYTENEAQDFFSKITIPDKSLKFYDAGHYLPEGFISDAIKVIIEE